MWDAFCSHKELSYLADFVLGLHNPHAVNGRVTLGIPLSSPVSAGDTINWQDRLFCLDSAFGLHNVLHANLPDFMACLGTVKSVPLDDAARQTCSPHKGISGWMRSKRTGQFTQYPVF